VRRESGEPAQWFFRCMVLTPDLRSGPPGTEAQAGHGSLIRFSDSVNRLNRRIGLGFCYSESTKAVKPWENRSRCELAMVAFRFFTLQLLMLWQGGFLFYASTVVPIGSRSVGEWEQGLITAQVTRILNIIGMVAMSAQIADTLANPKLKFWRLTVNGISLILLATLIVLHGVLKDHLTPGKSPRIENQPSFYRWHAAYLIVSGVQWVVMLVSAALMLRAWSGAYSSRSA